MTRRPDPAQDGVAGLVLAAGAGTRFGGPKGLARTPDGEPWVARAVRTLRAAGCDPVLVTVGAQAEAVSALVPADAQIVRVPDWDEGLAASLRAGLRAWLDDTTRPVAERASAEIDARAAKRAPASAPIAVDAAHASARSILVITVDTPDLPVEAVERMRARAHDGALAQAVYRGRPGHPVLIGRMHAPAIAETVTGDRGARPYLAAHHALAVECGDLWPGEDVDAR